LFHGKYDSVCKITATYLISQYVLQQIPEIASYYFKLVVVKEIKESNGDKV